MEPKNEVLEKVRATLAVSTALYLSTSAEDVPWVAGAYFAETDAFTLTVVLEGEGTTLRNLRANSHFSIVVSAGSPFEMFLQAHGDAVVSDDAAELARRSKKSKRRFPKRRAFWKPPSHWRRSSFTFAVAGDGHRERLASRA